YCVRDDPGYWIEAEGPALQIELLAAVNARNVRDAEFLLRDRLSPDLLAVAKDIAKTRVDAKRRGRARALFETLERGWQRLYAAHATAKAAYSDGWWRTTGDVPATWIAAVAGERWL